jgi:hypothetical protein
MKKLLITLLLISPFSFADWGDVYDCQMISHSKTTAEGERTDYRTEKFTFKLDKTKNAMVFGKGTYFKDSVLALRENMHWPSEEIWFAIGLFEMVYFDEGKFLLTVFNIERKTSSFISADCEKF